MNVVSVKLCCRAVTVLLLITLYNANPAFAQSCIHGSVRLVGSDSINEGRLEICLNGKWGTVCDDGWGYSESKVVCRQLRYPVDEPGIEEDISFKCCAQFGEGNGTVFLDDLKCSGDEPSLLDCRFSERPDCNHREDVGVICPALCPESTIRLTNGLTPHEGIVEVCMDGAWRGVCDLQWDYEDAFVACRQLGYPATGAISYDGSIIGSHLRPNITGLLCVGNESKLTDCKHSITAMCGASNTAAVYCQGEIATDGNCSEGELKLAGGSTNSEGRVEMCSNGIWGTICDANNWDSRDATVVCKQLGYKNPRVHVFTHDTSSYFGKRVGVILLDSIDCVGTELALHACKSSSHDSHRCSHDTDVGVRCEETDDSAAANCTNGDVRLIGGNNITEGLVEICVSGTWGSICDDSWGAQEMSVVCKQLGLQTAGSSDYTTQSVRSVGPYHLDNVDCEGDEANLLDCSHNGIGVHNCAPGKDAGVRCDAFQCSHADIRLVGGATMYEGRLEVCNSGHWGTVCDDRFRDEHASVVCRQLFGPNHESVHYCCGNFFGTGSGGLIIDDLMCSGPETRLLDCAFTSVAQFHNAGCNHGDDVVIRCYKNSDCTNGDVRLVDGRTELEGRVEICIDGIWGVIADNDWDYKAAAVVCRQLHLPSEWSIPLTSSYFGRGGAPILAFSMSCYGDETSINDCSYAFLSPTTLSFWHYSVASVMCQGNTTAQECTSGESRLVGGATENEGRVEVCVDGFWGTACVNEWDQEDAIVLCRQLGLQTAGTTLLPGGLFGEGTGPVFRFDCSSRESNLIDCEWTLGTPNCHHGLDAGVKCHAPYEYMVTVTTTPLQGPFSIGSSVLLHCSANVMPSECVTYTWQSSIPNPQLTSSSDISPNATILITAGHPQMARYFCHIQSCSSSAVLGIGSTALEIDGYLKPTRGEVLQYLPPERVTFSVTIGAAEVQYRFRDLRWYHNGAEIIPSSRVFLSDGNTTLTINTSSEADSGTYEVRYTGLVVRPYYRSCEVAVLNLLREYPVLMPTVFYLQSSAAATDKTVLYPAEQSTSIHFVGDANLGTVPFSDSGEITLDVNGKIAASVEGTVFTTWHHNGGTLPFGSNVGTLKKPLLRVSQSLETKRLNKIIDSGVYEVGLNVDAHTHFVSHLQCPVEYVELVYDIFLTDRITLTKDAVNLKYYEPPVVVFEADKEVIAADDIATLTCSAHGGYPPIQTISIVKDGHIIAVSSTGGSLMVSTETVLGAAHGLYSCNVNNSVLTEQHTVLLKEKGNILVQAMFVESGTCKEWSEFSLQESIREMIEILLPVIKEECNCDFSISNFQDSTITCDELGEVVTFDLTVVYSTEDGAITATSINEFVQNWLINGDKTTTITLSGETLQVSRPSCPLAVSQSHQNVDVSAGIIAGLFCGGVLFGVLLILIPSIIACVILKRHRGFNKAKR